MFLATDQHSLMPFLLAQTHAKPWAYMTSYSKLNGTHASESPRLVQDILRQEWGFDGICMVCLGLGLADKLERLVWDVLHSRGP